MVHLIRLGRNTKMNKDLQPIRWIIQISFEEVLFYWINQSNNPGRQKSWEIDCAYQSQHGLIQTAKTITFKARDTIGLSGVMMKASIDDITYANNHIHQLHCTSIKSGLNVGQGPYPSTNYVSTLISFIVLKEFIGSCIDPGSRPCDVSYCD